MQTHNRPVLTVFVSKARPLALALSAAMLMSSAAYGASFGHSRIVSAVGEPLRIDVPVTQISADDARSLRVSAATPLEWVQAGLMPPVDLNSLNVRVADGLRAGTKVIHVSSTQVLEQPVADLLLNVRTASGRQQIQVSILAPVGAGSGYSASARVGGGVASGGTPGVEARAHRRERPSIRVRRGDTLWSIAQHHAVPGVSIYQMMVALYRANPRAFIDKNLNLVKAGATLRVPDKAALTAISDREARRIFVEHVQAYARYRAGLAAHTQAAVKGSSAAEGPVTQAAIEPPAAPTSEPRDQVRLSSAQPSVDQQADARVATRKGIADSQERVTTLQENVKDLNAALQAQGGAAKNAVVEGASTLGQALSDAADAVAGGAVTGSSGTASEPASSGLSSASSNGSVPGKTGAPASSVSGGGEGPAAAAGAKAAVAESGPLKTASAQQAATGAAAQSASARSAATTSTETSSSEGSSAGTPSAGTPSAGTPSVGASSTGSGATTGAASTASAVPGSATATGAGVASGASGANADSAVASDRSGVDSKGSSGGSAATVGSTAPEGAVAGAPTLPGAPPKAEAPAKSDAPVSDGTTPFGQAVAPNGADSGDADAGRLGSDTKEQAMSWFQEHTLGVITGVLALLVLIIAWALRRANASRDDDGDGNNGLITEAMVKAKLDKINLDLRQPPADGSPEKASGRTDDHTGEPPSEEPATNKP